MSKPEVTTTKLDDAARAGWLYYVAGNTQDEIAAKLGVSRQSAQRMVSLAVSEGLVKVRLDHPIANCLDLAARLTARFGLKMAEVVPTDPGSNSTTLGVADAAAAEMTRWLKTETPVVVGIGTGRTLKAAIEILSPIDCPQHKVVSLTGNIAPDGSAAFYNVIFNIAEKIKARSFPMPLPVIASSPEERELLHSQPMIRSVLDLSAKADVAFIGIGDLEDDAPLYVDGFISKAELLALRQAGAVCEIVGHAFDRNGVAIEGLTNERVASALIPSRETAMVIAIAKGEKKMPGIAAALKGNLINGLITDERTAEALLAG
ncbi:sugar-binding transcriptional regulator [Phyllobacterium sp. YR531]|uniref:sugar-binding transcriptional regulator n=1 Tax=Phyllobacterium sp. YR531 TaxID=1144343 RepID=UPI00026F98FD|nr:sugar-binding transcriptional regulator [Phyllobacterium sp. YR531]EJN00531.1 transcriptional regulator with sigma factor-related N-terminal domain containing protein [Phyllobacterium sp. YR531]